MDKNLNNMIFIVGAGRAGTTTLLEVLGSHNDIGVCNHKEPCYFDRNQHLGIDWYTKLFPERNRYRYLAEASTNYLWYPNALEGIRESVVDPKIVISLRNPIKRGIAEYHRRIEKNGEQRTFSEIIRSTGYAEKRSRYVNNIKRAIDLFGRENVLIVIFEEWIVDTNSLTEQLSEFLNVENTTVIYL